MYKVPSRYVLTSTVLDAESARIDHLEIKKLQKRKGLTLLVDGWEDVAKRSLYGTVLAETGKHPVVLGLTDLTGRRASADVVVDVCDESLKKLLLDISQIAALCTDNPTVMRKVRTIWETKYSHIIVSYYY